jgi:uncharacterized protein (TIGR03086 family)
VRSLLRAGARLGVCRAPVLDVFIHGWDLAAATGQDTTLDPALLEACREVIEPQLAGFRAAGAIGEPLPVGLGACAQTRFLAELGRAG